MPAPRAVLAVAPLVVIASVSCRVATQQNELHEGDVVAESAQASRPGPSRTASAELDASAGALVPDASSDGDADTGALIPPPCAQQTMHSSAPKKSCEPGDILIGGGTLPLGNFHLVRWTDEQKGCSSGAYYSQRQGTMTIEDVGGKLFMRWTLWVDGTTSWGTYELTRTSPTSFVRNEVCNWTPQTPPVLTSYKASPTEILFFHDQGQERWVAIPKVSQSDSAPTPPISIGP